MKVRPGAKRQLIYHGASGLVARAVDAAVGAFAPGLAHRMRVARVKSSALLAYEAAKVDRLQPAPKSLSADGEILPDLDTLRARARQMVRDDAHAAAIVRTAEDNIVGTGIRPQACVDADEVGLDAASVAEWNRACEREFDRWSSSVADASRNGTFYDLQRLVVRTRKVDGEALCHAIVGGDGLVACELIDVDRLGHPWQNNTDTMRGGVEIGTHGEPVAYHILDGHPDDPGMVRAAHKMRRVLASNGSISIVQHVFRKERPGQTRGVPDFASSMAFKQHLHGYLTSEVIAARAASNYALFIKRQVDATDPDVLPVQPTEAGQTAEYHETIEPGTIQYLNEGEDPVPFSPNRPGAQFDSFVTRMLRAISSSQGMAYELVCKDFGGMNYSSARAMLLEVRRTFDAERALLVHQFCMPWWSNVIRSAIAAGRLPAPQGFADDPDAWLRVRWVAPAYGWVDPTKEIEASQQAVAANLSTPYEEAARGGGEAEANLLARARFLARAAELEREYGLNPGSLTQVAASQQQSMAVSEADAEDDEDELDDEDMQDAGGSDAATPST